MNASPYAVSASVTIASGCAGTGKTKQLVAAVAHLLEEGTPAEDIEIFAATPAACRSLQDRLIAAAGDVGNYVHISTVLERALGILAAPATVDATGRHGRILLKFEENILMEDMKTSEVHPKRLREMLRFLFHSWADLEPMDSTWFFSKEEERVYSLLKRTLYFLDGYLAHEVARAAHDFLVQHPESLEVFGTPHVFVDDYQTLSKASQCLAGMLARQTLWAAGDEDAGIAPLEEFPFAKGLTYLLEANPTCQQIHLKKSFAHPVVASAIEALRTDNPLESATTSTPFERNACSLLDAKRPQDEFEGVVASVRHAMAQGVAADAISVAVPNDIWEQRIAQKLTEAKVDVERTKRTVFGGDTRSLERCKEAQTITLLRLAANPTDQLALRCWCGFGDYLANSGIFSSVMEQGGFLSFDHGIVWGASSTQKDALIHQGEARIRERLKNAAEALRSMKGAQGSDLVMRASQAVGGHDANRITSIVSNLPDDADAAAIIAELESLSLLPKTQGCGVRVAPLDQFVGRPASFVIVAGMVNGFIPRREYFDPTIIERDKRPAILKKARTKIYSCAGKAQEAIAFSFFREASLIEAEKLKLKIYRVRLQDKERICEIHPSEALNSITREGKDD